MSNPKFDEFVSTATAMGGNDLSRAWLKELFEGADGDVNRAINHLLDTPEEKYRREAGGGSGGAEAAQSSSTRTRSTSSKRDGTKKSTKKSRKSDMGGGIPDLGAFPTDFDSFPTDTGGPAGMAGMMGGQQASSSGGGPPEWAQQEQQQQSFWGGGNDNMNSAQGPGPSQQQQQPPPQQPPWAQQQQQPASFGGHQPPPNVTIAPNNASFFGASSGPPASAQVNDPHMSFNPQQQQGFPGNPAAMMSGAFGVGPEMKQANSIQNTYIQPPTAGAAASQQVGPSMTSLGGRAAGHQQPGYFDAQGNMLPGSFSNMDPMAAGTGLQAAGLNNNSQSLSPDGSPSHFGGGAAGAAASSTSPRHHPLFGTTAMPSEQSLASLQAMKQDNLQLQLLQQQRMLHNMRNIVLMQNSRLTALKKRSEITDADDDWWNKNENESRNPFAPKGGGSSNTGSSSRYASPATRGALSSTRGAGLGELSTANRFIENGSALERAALARSLSQNSLMLRGDMRTPSNKLMASRGHPQLPATAGSLRSGTMTPPPMRMASTAPTSPVLQAHQHQAMTSPALNNYGVAGYPGGTPGGPPFSQQSLVGTSSTNNFGMSHPFQQSPSYAAANKLNNLHQAQQAAVQQQQLQQLQLQQQLQQQQQVLAAQQAAAMQQGVFASPTSLMGSASPHHLNPAALGASLSMPSNNPYAAVNSMVAAAQQQAGIAAAQQQIQQSLAAQLQQPAPLYGSTTPPMGMGVVYGAPAFVGQLM